MINMAWKLGQESFEKCHICWMGSSTCSVCRGCKWLLHGDKDCIWMTKERKQIVFDIKILTPKGAVYAKYFNWLDNKQGELANGMIDGGGTKLTINQAHAKLGHIGEDAMRKIAGHFEWHLTQGTITACELCAVGKEHQQNLGHCSEELVLTDCMHMHLDISSCSFL